MPDTYTDTAVDSLIINKMTQEQYDNLPEKSNSEIYLIDAGGVNAFAEQVVEMPLAIESKLGVVVQYIGNTDAEYTSGFFYKCIALGTDPETYSWTQVNVQPTNGAGPLPDQTGKAGKVLKTDGANLSWGNATSSPSTMPILYTANWSRNQQTINVANVTANNVVIVSPSPVSAEDYAAAGVLCTAQGNGTLTFTCNITPVNNLTVNVVCL